MSRLPNLGQDDGVWGSILNDYLSQIHNSDGSLKNDVVTTVNIPDGSVTESKLNTAVANKLNSLPASPTPFVPLAGTVMVNTQSIGGTWSMNSSSVASARTNGYKIMWFTTPAGAVPTVGDGLVNGDVVKADIVTGGAPAPTPKAVIAVTNASAPALIDADNTANDKIVLTKVANITWRVGTNPGVEYNEASFGGNSTQTVPYTGGNTVEVSAVPGSSGYTVSGSAIWQLPFTNATTGNKLTIPISQYPTMQDNPSTASDTVTIRKVGNVIWNINGTAYPSSAMVGSTQVVNYTGGDTTVVTATPESGWTIAGPTSWSFSFTNVPAGGASWKVWLNEGFNGPDKTFVASEKYGGDGVTTYMNMSKDAQITDGRLCIPATIEAKIRFAHPSPVDKIRLSFDAVAEFEFYLNQSIYFTSSGKQDVGFVLSGNSMKFGETGQGFWGTLAVTSGLPATTWKLNDRVTIVFDNPSNAVTTYINGVLSQTYTITNTNRGTAYAPEFYSTSYSTAPFTMDNLLIEDYK